MLNRKRLNRKSLIGLSAAAAMLSVMVAALPAQANCPGSIIPIEEAEPAMQARWEQLQRMDTYPWGSARVYDRLFGSRITLAASFDQLTGAQKQQALEMLQLGTTPYQVFASDGRLLSASYDACTRFNTLTERQRYGWYYNAVGRSLPTTLPREALRNAGRPSWREVRVAIAPAQEQQVRRQFWSAIGYSQAANGWWIAWVPEHGYFEINAPTSFDSRQLPRLWTMLPQQYRYVMVAADGTPITNAR